MWWAAIIQGVLAIGASAVQAGLQRREGRNARAEAREIAEQTRGDVLRQREFDNTMTSRGLALGDRQLAHSSRMLDENIASMDRSKEKAELDRHKGIFTQSVQQFDEQKEDVVGSRAIAQRRFL